VGERRKTSSLLVCGEEYEELQEKDYAIVWAIGI
jgi:hypothetical protein